MDSTLIPYGIHGLDSMEWGLRAKVGKKNVLIFYTTITHSTLPAKIYEFNVYSTWNRHLSKVQGEK